MQTGRFEYMESPEEITKLTTPTDTDKKYVNLKEVYHLFHDLPLEIAMYDAEGCYKFVNKLYEPDEDIRRKMIGKDFDLTLFLMGAAFLLIETRGITSLSLLFGSTWVVNASIFSGVLTMVLLANLVVNRFRLKDPRLCFVGLFFSVYLVCAFNLGALNAYPLLVRGVMGGLLIALPIGFAGLIVSILLVSIKRRKRA